MGDEIRVLVVDDSALVRKVFSQELSKSPSCNCGEFAY